MRPFADAGREAGLRGEVFSLLFSPLVAEGDIRQCTEIGMGSGFTLG